MRPVFPLLVEFCPKFRLSLQKKSSDVRGSFVVEYTYPLLHSHFEFIVMPIIITWYVILWMVCQFHNIAIKYEILVEYFYRNKRSIWSTKQTSTDHLILISITHSGTEFVLTVGPRPSAPSDCRATNSTHVHARLCDAEEWRGLAAAGAA